MKIVRRIQTITGFLLSLSVGATVGHAANSVSSLPVLHLEEGSTYLYNGSAPVEPPAKVTAVLDQYNNFAFPCDARPVFANAVADSITDQSTVTSTITVSGAGIYLTDVDVTTFIRHSFPADLDVTLSSPAGTVVTLTSDNGADKNDVFNGTIWDDQANPYALTNNLVARRSFSDAVVASPLVPEEALGAFAGENPNGIWTLRISDDSTGDTGMLDHWSLAFHTLPVVPIEQVQTFVDSTPHPIPAGGISTINSVITVVGAGSRLSRLKLTTNLVHSSVGDLDLSLRSSQNGLLLLSLGNGGSFDNILNGTVWQDLADPGNDVPFPADTFVASNLISDTRFTNNLSRSSLVPEEAMDAFFGIDPNGSWLLTVADHRPGNGGALNGWALEVTTISFPAQETCNGVDDNCNGQVDEDALGIDTDGDGLRNACDNCPTVFNSTQLDSDHDGRGNACDNCPGASNPGQSDADQDARGDACDTCTDTDRDGFGNPGFPASTCPIDNCPGTPNPGQTDGDADGIGDACDPCPDDPGDNDPDHDGICVNADNCPTIPNPTQEDSDGDSLGDACDPCPADNQNDQDGDGICRGSGFAPPMIGDHDNCPLIANSSQANADNDLLGDVCDGCVNDSANDQDSDGVCGDVDNCPTIPNANQANADADASGDVCDNCPGDLQNDRDNDGICSGSGYRPPKTADHDNCPDDQNTGQADFDSDDVGDACDNCLFDPNTSQEDQDQNLEGDRCDTNDGLIVVFFVDRSHIDWQAEPQYSSWNVYEGDLDVLKSSGTYTQLPGSNPLAANHCHLSQPYVDDPSVPPVRKTVFSLVTGIQNGVEGSLGKNSHGVERPNSAPCP